MSERDLLLLSGAKGTAYANLASAGMVKLEVDQASLFKDGTVRYEKEGFHWSWRKGQFTYARLRAVGTAGASMRALPIG